jgi:signal transduction histidine kinase/CheY-like chemotaxis protein
VSLITALLAATALALLAALLLVRRRERRADATAKEERRLRLELEAKQRALDEAAADMKAGQLRLLQAEKVASLSGLVAGITHELNNPLAVISGFAELLLAKAPDDFSREALDAIHGEAKRCSRIVQNLLSFSRQRRVTKAAVDVNEIIDHVLELLRYKLSLDGVTVETRLDRRMPPALGDLTQMQQVVLHLVLNAHGAVLDLPSEEPRRIEIETRAEGGEVVLAVADTGRGISEEDARRIFDPFFWSGAHGREGGLGLAVCYGIVTEHGGTIALASELGHGSRLTVRLAPAGPAAPSAFPSGEQRTSASGRIEKKEYLPAASARGEGDPTASSAALAALAEKTPRQVGLLIADDEDAIVRLLTQVFTRQGYRCGAARDGREALRLLRSGAYEVAIVDIVMPFLTGLELYKELLPEAPALASRLIFTTGDAGGAETRAFLEGVPNRRVRKPFEIQEVTRVVAEVAAAPGRPVAP